jgi:uncharacterized protein (TIGR02996 family)
MSDAVVPRGALPFVAACMDSPDDPDVRLVLADWLDDRGDRRGVWLRELVRAWEPAAALPSPEGELTAVDRDRLWHDAGRYLRQGAVSDPWRICRAWFVLCLRHCPVGSGYVWELLNGPARAAVAGTELYACDLTTKAELARLRKAALLGTDDLRGWEVAAVVSPGVATRDAAEAAGQTTPYAANIFGRQWADFRWCVRLAALLPAWVPALTDP